MTEHRRLLLVDDDTRIARSLVPVLEHAGFTVAVARNGREALAQVERFAPHLILLDVLMPGMDGREVLRRLRERNTRTAVIMLTQVDGPPERIGALAEGADDYVSKPFDPLELLARIEAVLRRTGESRPALSTAARLGSRGLVLDRRAACAYLDNEPLDLPPKTLALLEYLLGHPNELLSRERLLNVLWGYSDALGTRMVDNRICELRRLLRDDVANPRFIETVPGHGYRFVGPVEALP
jgi:DNA-binding response OmpR family regulator